MKGKTVFLVGDLDNDEMHLEFRLAESGDEIIVRAFDVRKRRYVIGWFNPAKLQDALNSALGNAAGESPSAIAAAFARGASEL
jgi:hypothetical protein